MKKILIRFFIIFIISFCFFEANSFDIKTLGTINSSVIDKVGVLSSTEKQNLETKIQEIRQKYTAEIFLVIIPSTDGEEISQVGTQIGQDIGVGKSDKDNGVVILIAINDRAWNISTGYGVEGALPDLLVNRIGEQNFILFKNKEYYNGINGSLSDIDLALSGDLSIISNQKDKIFNKFKNINSDDLIGYIIIISIFVFLFIGIILKSLLKEKKYKKFFIIFGIANIISLIILYFIIKDFLYTLIINFIFWLVLLLIDGNGKGSSGSYSGGGGGGGFGGFGGGSFGGGGSSGKW